MISNLIKSKYFSELSLTSSTKLVLVGLMAHFNFIRKDAFPSQKLIQDELGLSEASVVRAIKELLKEGLIVKTRNRIGNKYFFTQKFLQVVNCQIDSSKLSNCKMHDKNKTKNKINNNYTPVRGENSSYKEHYEELKRTRCTLPMSEIKKRLKLDAFN